MSWKTSERIGLEKKFKKCNMKERAKKNPFGHSSFLSELFLIFLTNTASCNFTQN